MEKKHFIAEEIVQRLIQKGWKIAFAESCTGGLAAATLVEVPDASRVFDESIVTYANDAKIKYLGVQEQTIAEHGVVSEQVAGQMDVGIAHAAHAEIGVGVSGVAGPTGGTKRKPVGMVCFGFWVNGTLTTKTVQFGEIGRNHVRKNSVEYIYNKIEKLS